MMTVDDEIQDVRDYGRPHVVILGAGGSVAALPNGDKNGNVLPTMDNFIEVLKLDDVLSKSGLNYKSKNFEHVYAKLYRDPEFDEIRKELEIRVHSYFKNLELPDEPNLYDYLVLSLRKKDLICTFNWDPFLIQAYRRNAGFTRNLPPFVFLHGNVMTGYCPQHERRGAIDGKCEFCGKFYQPSKLLYPIENKDYSQDTYIKNEWEIFDWGLYNAWMITIFGYGAPDSDVKAIELMKKSWSAPGERRMEEVELIDIKSEDALRKQWDPFIVSHHYQTTSEFFDSWISTHPRRTIEAYYNQNWDIKFLDGNPVPHCGNFNKLWEWFTPLVQAEQRANKSK